MEPGVGEKLCRLWAKIASDDDILTDPSVRRDNQDHRTSGRNYAGHSGSHDFHPRHTPMPYHPHPMFNPYGYAHMSAAAFYRPMAGDARNQIGHPAMMQPPRLGLHHGGPFRPSRPWWNTPPPHHAPPHYVHNNNKPFPPEFKPSQPPPSAIAPSTTTSSNSSPPTNSPVTSARSKNAYSAQRARKQQLKQKQQEAVSTSVSKSGPHSRAIEIKAPPSDSGKSSPTKKDIGSGSHKKTENKGAKKNESSVDTPSTSSST